MQCPKCQTEVPDMHFFCTNCLTQVRSFGPEDTKRRGIVERVGSVLIDLLLIVFIIGGAILIARQINWGDLVYGFQGTTEALTEANSGKSAKSNSVSVTITSITPAQVYIDGQLSGKTPHTIKLMPGDHQVKVVADGYLDWTRKIRVKNRQKFTVRASMKKKAG